MHWTCTSAAAPGGRARLRISPPTWPATTPSSSVRWTSSPRPPAGRRCCVYGHSAGGLIVSLWLDRLQRRGATAAKHVNGLVLNSPWLDLQGPAILRTVGTAAIGAVSRLPQKAGGPLADRGRVRHLAASRLSRRIRLRPELEAGRRFPGDLRLDQRDQARARPAAPRAGRRSAQPDPAVGPQRARGARSRSDPARRRGARRQADRPVGGLHRQPDDDRAHRRRQTRRLPVAGRSRARPRSDELENWLDWYTEWSRIRGRHSTIRTEDDPDGTFRHRDHRYRLGQLHTGRALHRQARRDMRTGHLRRNLPQRRLHPDQDVRLRRRGGPKRPGHSTLRRRRHPRRCQVERHRLARVRPDRPDRDGRRELPPLVTERRGVRHPHPLCPDATPTAATRCAPMAARSSPRTRW